MLKVENQAEISLGCLVLDMKATLYLLAKLRFGYQLVQELLANQTLKISISDEELPARGKPITDSRVRDVMSKFSSKYGDVRKYYPKPDVAVEVPL